METCIRLDDPFADSAALEFLEELHDIASLHIKDDAVDYLFRFTVYVVMDLVGENGTSELDEEFCRQTWMAAIVFLRALNGIPVSGETQLFEDAVTDIQQALERKKFLSKKLRHSVSTLCKDMCAALDFIVAEDTELAVVMQHESTAFCRWQAEISQLKNDFLPFTTMGA